MLTWKQVHEWAGAPEERDRHSGYFRGWFWTALLASYGMFSSTRLLQAAAKLAAQHREHPDYSIHPDERYCRCHMRPRLSGLFEQATWEGDYSVAAWHHLPLIKAYLLALLARDEAAAMDYLRMFAESRRGLAEAFDIARGIGDIPRAHALAREIVDQFPQRVYFFCRGTVDDPELLEHARRGLLADPNPQQAEFCANAVHDAEFLERIRTERSALAG